MRRFFIALSGRAFLLLAAMVLPSMGMAQATGAESASPRAGDAAAATAAAAQGPQITRYPQMLEFAEADYPPKSFAEGREARVVLQFTITAAGAVTQVEVAEPSAYPGEGFEQAAVNAATRFRFSPAEIDGKPAPVRILYEYNFVIRRSVTTDIGGATPSASGEPAEAPVNFTGVLLSRGTKEKIAGAGIVITETGAKDFTDADGRFSFRGVPPGRYIVAVEAKGYEPFKTGDLIVEGKVTEVRYYLQKTSYNPYEIRVRARKEVKEVVQRTISVQEIRKIPGANGDTLRVVQNLPGVARVPGFGGALLVRGGEARDSGVFLEGQRIPRLFHFGGLRATVNSDVVQDINFFPGGYSAYYGRNIAGIVDITLKEPRLDRLHGVVDANLFDTGVALEIPLTSKMGLTIAGHRSYYDLILPLVIPQNSGVDLTVAPVYYDYQVLYSFNIDAKHKLKIYLFGSDDEFRLLNPEPPGADPAFRGTFFNKNYFHRLQTNYTFKPSRDVQNVVVLGAGYEAFLLKVGQPVDVDARTWLFTMRDTLTLRFTDWLSLRAGTDNEIRFDTFKIIAPGAPPKEGEVTNPGTSQGVRQAVIEGWQADAALFAELQFLFDKKLAVNPGIRADYYSDIRLINFGPRLNTRWQFLEGTAVKGAIGLYSQAPTGDETAESIGNPDLIQEYSWQYSLGFEQQILSFLKLDVVGFFNDMNNLVVRADSNATRINSNGEVVPLNQSNQGAGRSYGMEFLLRHDPTQYFFGWIAYTLSRGERRARDEQPYRLFTSDQTHILTTLGTFRLPHEWEIGFRFRLASGNLRTPLLRGVYDADNDTYLPIPGATNSVRNPLFHSLDLRVDKKYIFDEWTLDFYLDVQNVYNNRGVEGVQYSYDYAASTEFMGLPIFPAFGVRAEF
ncbi:MAG: hypothetical protein GMKNLPBB_02573 [Myxococcota bacterium]|nr:hypothetical protein [Myxococcota bacterium]